MAVRAEILATTAAVTSDATLLAGAAFKAAPTAPSPAPALRAAAPAAGKPASAGMIASQLSSEPSAAAPVPLAASDRRAALGDEATTRFYRSRAPAVVSALRPDGTVLNESDRGRVAQEPEADRFRRLDAEKAETFAKMKSSDTGAAARPAPLVLDGFLVEQNGSSIRLVDGDGSVYVGAMEAATGAGNTADFDADGLVRETRSKESELRADKTVALRSAVGRATASSAFRVSGTNRTSGQLIVVSGRLGGAAPTNSLTPTSGLVTGGATVGGAGVGSNATTNRVVEIDGTMRVGESAWQWFRAVRSQP